MKKTTIAIVPESRKTLGLIKDVLEAESNRFVDMNAVVRYLLKNLPEDMKTAIQHD